MTHFGGEISHNVGGKAFAEIAATVTRIFGKQPLFAKDFLTLHVDREGNVVESVSVSGETEQEEDHEHHADEVDGVIDGGVGDDGKRD